MKFQKLRLLAAAGFIYLCMIPGLMSSATVIRQWLHLPHAFSWIFTGVLTATWAYVLVRNIWSVLLMEGTDRELIAKYKELLRTEISRREQNQPETWLIWSQEHGAWWMPDSSGYTRDFDKAGRYSLKEATEICANANRDSERVQESMFPAP